MTAGTSFSAPISLLSASVSFIALATVYTHTLAFDLWIERDLVTRLAGKHFAWSGPKFYFVQDNGRQASARINILSFLYLTNVTRSDNIVLYARVPELEVVNYWTWFEQTSGNASAIHGSISIPQNGTLLNGSLPFTVTTQCLKQLLMNADTRLNFSYSVFKNGSRIASDQTYFPFKRNCEQATPTAAETSMPPTVHSTGTTATATTTAVPGVASTAAETSTVAETSMPPPTPAATFSRTGDKEGSDSSSSSGTIVVILIVVGIAVALVLCIVAYLLWQRRLRKRELPRSAALEEAAVSSELPYASIRSSRSSTQCSEKKEIVDTDEMLAPFDKRFTINSRKLRFGKQLGQGAFGVVYEGWFGQQHVAIKTMKSVIVRGDTEKEVAKFIKEAKIMQDFDHPNILPLIGVSPGADSLPRIIVPFMSNGDMLSFLRQHNPSTTVGATPLPEDMLVSFTVQIAQGMAYLADKNFVHRDLAARNCMLSEDAVVKIADFGLTRDIEDEFYYKMQSEFRLPIRWMAIESLSFHKFSCQSDVWSYGIVLWEIFTLGQIPYSSMENVHITQYLQTGKRLSVPQDCPPKIGEVMLDCWQFFPSERPSFQQILRRLESYNKEAYENIMLMPCYMNVHDMSPSAPLVPKKGSRNSRLSETGSTLSQMCENNSMPPVTSPTTANMDDYEEMRRRQTAESKRRL